MVHRDHDAATGHHLHLFAAGHAGDLPRPRAAGVQHELAVDHYLFAALLVVGTHGPNGTISDVDVSDAVVGQDLGTVTLGVVGGTPDQLPSVDRGIHHGEGSLDARVHPGFAAQGLGDGEFLERHLGLGRTLGELGRVVQVVVRAHDEQSPGVLDGMRLDATKHLVLLGTLGGRVRV
ncbi:Uncharacterised protein [Mycobacteroides abscessus subsp. abscessus]|nr:Uncharacterised protein [Mycobacteroides abscessus subsp. abscessus]